MIDTLDSLGLARFLAKLLLFLTPLLMVFELTNGNWLGDHRFDQLVIQRNVKRSFSKVYCRGCAPERILFETDKYGFRGHENDVSHIDILTVGASTTVQQDLNEGDTYQAEIRRRFGERGIALNVVNAGLDGQSSRGYLNNFDQWYAMVPGMRARYALFYLGVDEIQRNEEEMKFNAQMNELKADHVSLQHWIANNSATVFVARGLASTWYSRAFEGRGHGDVEFTDPDWTADAHQTAHGELFRKELAAFGERIESLAARTERFGARPVFVLGREGSYEFRNGRWEGLAHVKNSSRYDLTGVDVLYITREMAKVMSDVCRKTQAICLDLSEAKDFDERDFYDFRHTTPSGSRKVGALLTDGLTSLFSRTGSL